MMSHERHSRRTRAMSVKPIATLCGPGDSHTSWRWELSAADDGRVQLGIPLPELGMQELLEAVAEVDRVHACSEYTYAVAARNAVVERLLNSTWRALVEPLVRYLGGAPSLTVRLPQQLLRLPIATARRSTNGESLVHLSDVTIQSIAGLGFGGSSDGREQSTDYRPRLPGHQRPHRWYSDARIHRLDGHPEDIQVLLDEVAVESSETVLLMGCRTVDLLPRIECGGITAAIVTLWDVEDRDCEPLGDALIAAMATGLAPSEALRSVQALKSGRPPFEWAGYVAVEASSPQPVPARDEELVAR